MIVLLLALAAATARPPVLAVPAVALADDRLASPEPRLAWPAGTRLSVEEAEGELIVRYDRPLPMPELAAFRDAAGPAIGDLRWNDDNLVLRAAPGWRLRWQRLGATLSVAFLPVPQPAAPVAKTDDGAKDLAMAAIEADAAAGYTGRARRAAARLATAHPGDPQTTRLLADARLADGDVRGAAAEYRALQATDRTARRAIAAAPGTAALTLTARDGSDMTQVESAARVDAAIDDRFAAGGGLRHIVSDIADARSTALTIADATLAVRLADSVRVQILAAAALDDDVTGGGARLVAGSPDAQFRATLTRHMPDVSTPAQALAGGYLSRALAGVTYRLSPGIVAQAEGGTNRYGLTGGTGASDTIVANGGLDFLIRRQFPALGLTYRFEAEYVQRMRTAPNGLPLIPLATRENHTVQGLVSGALGEVQLTALAGWTVDRFGGDGPTASLGASAPIGIGWRVEGSGGITSVARPGFTGRQLFARAAVTRSLGTAP